MGDMSEAGNANPSGQYPTIPPSIEVFCLL